MAFDSDLHGHHQPDLRYPEGKYPDLLGLLHQRDGHAHRHWPHPHCAKDLRQYNVAPDRPVHRGCRCSSNFSSRRWLMGAHSFQTGSISPTPRTPCCWTTASRAPALRAKA
jgi:hypothetical protein